MIVRWNTLLRRGASAIAVTLGVTFGSPSYADNIDADLARGFDFRSILYRPCYGLETCTVGTLEIIPQARLSEEDPWDVAELYWDPIDGLGVLGGGQDDEIDFNERIIIRSTEPIDLEKVWLTDLFIGEIKRYWGYQGDLRREVDYESARIQLDPEQPSFEEHEVSGVVILPPDPFNEAIDGGIFIEPGDIHDRLIIDGPRALLLVFDPVFNGTRTIVGTFLLDQIDAGKLNLFADGDILEFDLREIFGETEVVELFDPAHNAGKMAGILDQTERLLGLRFAAEVRRGVGDIPNGEVVTEFLEPQSVYELVFFAPAGTSNDFSIGGLRIAEEDVANVE